MEKYNLYIKTTQITKENLEEIPKKDLLPIFLDSDLRPNHLVSCYHKTAIHFYNLSPTRYLISKVMAGMSKEDFKTEYFTELLSKDWAKIIQRLEFLKDLSGAVGIVLMSTEETPSFIDVLMEFLNKSGFFVNEVTPY